MTPMLLHDLVRVDAEAGTRPAIVDGGQVIDHGALSAAVDRMAARLVAAGITRGDRVAILLPKSTDECIAFFAVSRADGVVVPINPVLKSQQIQHILDDCGARLLITSTAQRRAHDVQIDDVLLVDMAETSANEPLPPSLSIGQDLAAILYTSGSTGKPKGVMLSHANLLAGARIVCKYLSITADERILSVLPFSFDYGLNQLLTAVQQKATIVLAPPIQLGDQLVKLLAAERITALAGVPTIWAMLTRGAPSLKTTSLPYLRYITNSGGAVPEATARQLRTLLPSTRIFLMYGLTEAFRSTYLPPDEIDSRPTSIGRAIPECEVFPVTPDGRRAKPGEPGILVHRGPTVSLGYWKRPADTERVLKPNPLRPATEGGDIVCYSGDLVVEDDDGYLYFVGRQDAMIKSAGYRISPTEVEDVLMGTGAFRHVAVIGVPDDWVGQKVCAVGVAADGVVDTKAVLAATSTRLPSYMVPSRIEFVDRLPTTPNGKIDYKHLVAERAS